MPPTMMRFPNSAPNPAQGTPNVVSAAPQLINRDDEEPTAKPATIEAKAKMRSAIGWVIFLKRQGITVEVKNRHFSGKRLKDLKTE